MLHATKMSWVRMCAFWFICGGIGNWFGSVCNSSGPLTVGSNPGNFALWGGVIACFIVNWKKLDSMAQIRCPIIIVLIVITLLLLYMSAIATASS